MRDKRGLGILVAVALAVAVGTGGGGEVASPSFPPGVEELLPHAVVLREASVLRAGVQKPLQVVLLSDVDGDGVVDLVASSSEGPRVFLGDGTGQFTAGCSDFYEAQRTPLGGGQFLIKPLAMMTALYGAVFRSDDRECIAVATFGMQNPEGPYGYWLYTFENRYGCLKREAVAELPFPLHFFQQWKLADGSVQLVGTSIQDNQTLVVVLTPNGESSFSAPVLVTTARGWPVYWGDVTADGRPDLVLWHRDEVTVLPSLADGGFELPVHIAIPGQRVQDVAIGDTLGDGRPELVVLTDANELVSYQVSGSSVEERARQELYTAHIATAVELADMTGDGVLDLIVFRAAGQMAAILSGRGDGTFRSEGSEFWLPVPSLQRWPVDLTGEGRADLVVASPYTVHVLRNGGLPVGTSWLPVAEILAVGDVSGNSAPDLVLQADRGLEILWNNGSGAFVRSPFTRFPEVGPEAIRMDLRGQTHEVIIQDDVAWALSDLRPVAAQVVEGGVVVLLKRTETETRQWLQSRLVHELRWMGHDGTQLRAVRLPGEEVVPAVSTADLDGDGATDVVVLFEGDALVWWGGTEAPVTYPLPSQAYLLAIGDVTGDGVDDVVVVGADQDAHVVVLSFRDRTLSISEPLIVFDLFSVPMAMAVADFDGDGVDDVAVAATRLRVDSTAGSVSLDGTELWITSSRRADGTHTLLLPLEGDAPWPLAGLVAGDFDGDGQTDLALTTAGGAGVFLLWGEGDGRFASPVRLWVPGGALLAGDLDANGQPELIAQVLGMSPATWILWNGGGR